jgi:hypothetical protein
MYSNRIRTSPPSVCIPHGISAYFLILVMKLSGNHVSKLLKFGSGKGVIAIVRVDKEISPMLCIRLGSFPRQRHGTCNNGQPALVNRSIERQDHCFLAHQWGLRTKKSFINEKKTIELSNAHSLSAASPRSGILRASTSIEGFFE